MIFPYSGENQRVKIGLIMRIWDYYVNAYRDNNKMHWYLISKHEYWLYKFFNTFSLKFQCPKIGNNYSKLENMAEKKLLEITLGRKCIIMLLTFYQKEKLIIQIRENDGGCNYPKSSYPRMFPFIYFAVVEWYRSSNETGGQHRWIVCLGSTFGGSVHSNYTESGWVNKILLFIAPPTRRKLLMVVTMKNDFLLSKDFQMSRAKVKNFLMIIIKKYGDGVLEEDYFQWGVVFASLEMCSWKRSTKWEKLEVVSCSDAVGDVYINSICSDDSVLSMQVKSLGVLFW